MRKGQLNRHARESARSARSAPRPPHLSTRNTDWPLRSRRALNLLAVKRDTQGQTTFLYLHSFSFTTPQQDGSHTRCSGGLAVGHRLFRISRRWVQSSDRGRSGPPCTQARHASFIRSHPGLSQWSLHLAILVSSILIMTASDRPEDGRTYTMFTRCATAAEAKYTRARCQNCSPRDPSWSC